jgi:hypothetical protein
MAPNFSRRTPGRLIVCLLVGAASLLASACGQPEEGVRAYDASKPEPEPRGKNRILAAILGQEKAGKTWFIKLVGPTDLVDKHEKEFDGFVESIRFEGGNPKWTVPAAWSKLPDEEARFAGFQVGPADDDVELTVSVLPLLADKQLLDNVNRWRAQLKRLPVAEEEVGSFTREIQGPDYKGYRVDLTGNGPGRTQKMAKPAAPIERGAAHRSFNFTKPEGWVETKEQAAPNKISIPREATFRVTEGAETALVTVIVMDRTGPLPAQVDRWAGEVGLPGISEEELRRMIRDIPVENNLGHLVHLEGPEGPDRKGTVAVMVSHNGRNWFFKMTGPAGLVAKQKPAFEAFVKSVKFEGGR